MGVRIAGQRLARRLQGQLPDALERRHLRAVEYEHGLEQHAGLAGLLCGGAVVLLDGQRRDDPDRLLALLDRIPQRSQLLKPATNVASGRAIATSS
jgi:hypothetical protein